MDLRVIAGSFVAAILFFFGGIFAIASAYNPGRLVVSALFFTAGFGLLVIVFVFTRKPTKIIQKIELSGEMKPVPIKCPSCGAAIAPESIKIVDGVPYAKCSYCNNTVEVAEEPKW